MAGFQYRKNLLTKDAPTLLEFIIDNSVTVTLGDAVSIDTNGHAILAVAGDEILGIVQGVVDKKGIKVTPDSGTTDTYTVASDNETVAQKVVQVIVDKYSLFSNDASSDLATTNLMQFFNLTDEDQVNTSSAADTNGQVQLISLDPDGDGDASKGLFRIAESVLDPYTQD